MSWSVYQPDDKLPWNLRRVWTLHRRAGFAATWSELQRDLSDGPASAIDRLLAAESRQTGIPDDFARISGITGEAAIATNRDERLIAWWIYHMYFSPDPLRERLVIMWHNHFATSNAKLRSLRLMREQNENFRRLGLGDFQSLLNGTLKHAAMLKWLDGDKNQAGRPNENLGRETLELFTLGVGNYTEDDVKNASRALTGWSVNRQNSFQVRDDWHDDQPKTILGQTGNFDGDDLVEITCNHPATASRIAWRLCETFLSASLVTREHVAQLAERLIENSLNIQFGVETILRSQLFFSEENLKTRIIEPEPFTVGTARALELFESPVSTMILGDWVEQLGRKLFYPPNVGGWPGGRAWLDSRTTIARANFGVALVNGRLNRAQSSPELLALAESHVARRDWKAVAGFYCDLLTGTRNPEQIDKLIHLANENAGNENEIAAKLVALILASPDAQLA